MHDTVRKDIHFVKKSMVVVHLYAKRKYSCDLFLHLSLSLSAFLIIEYE